MLPSNMVLEQARQTRDARFDGRFFIAVRTTGIYCRPVCRVKMPKPENVSFYASAAAATEAGYRPCLRCRPEVSPGTPAWMGTSTTVTRALRLINDGALDDSGVARLGDRLGVTSRHLTRLFAEHLGASPKTLAQTRRLQFAKKLIDETSLSMTQIAMSAGYGSIRRFNDHFKSTYQRTPRSLRSERAVSPNEKIQLKVSYREPFDFPALLSFYQVRATPGIEQVKLNSTQETSQSKAILAYQRTFIIDESAGVLRVSDDSVNKVLNCEIEGGDARSLIKILTRVRRMFDTDAIPQEIDSVLSVDPILKKLIIAAPGLRLPGAFGEFEVAVRAIVGQQVSVKGATTVMGKIVELCGDRTSFGRVFPRPETLAALNPALLPMPRKRGEAIRSLAAAVAMGDVTIDSQDGDVFRRSLMSIAGIGPWTADYIAMRALSDPDAFLQGDLVIKKVASALFGIHSEKELLARAEQWRPWRGYAGMHLWRYAVNL